MEYENMNGRVETTIIPSSGLCSLWRYKHPDGTYTYDLRKVVGYHVELTHPHKGDDLVVMTPLGIDASGRIDDDGDMTIGTSFVDNAECIFVGSWKECQGCLLERTNPEAAAKQKEFDHQREEARTIRMQRRLERLPQKKQHKENDFDKKVRQAAEDKRQELLAHLKELKLCSECGSKLPENGCCNCILLNPLK